MQVGVTVTLEISAHDPNEEDEVFFTFNDTAPDGANISSGMENKNCLLIFCLNVI